MGSGGPLCAEADRAAEELLWAAQPPTSHRLTCIHGLQSTGSSPQMPISPLFLITLSWGPRGPIPGSKVTAGERGDRAQSRAPRISARSVSLFVGFADLLASLCCYLLNIALRLHYLNRLVQSEHLHCYSEWKNLYHLPQIGNTHKNKPRLIKT